MLLLLQHRRTADATVSLRIIVMHRYRLHHRCRCCHPDPLVLQEIRHLLLRDEATLVHQRRGSFYDGGGPDTKTCTRLLNALTDMGLAQSLQLQYQADVAQAPRKVCAPTSWARWQNITLM